MIESVLSLTNLIKRYGDKPVLDGVSLDIPKGSVFGLIGKNGAGKSTLLKCALGLIRSWQGSARILGEETRALSAVAKARIGYVAQPPAMLTWMTVADMIAYTGGFYPHWNQDLVTRLVRDWDLRAKDVVGKLSPGQAQRLALVLALGHEPDLLVLDEPAGSLDPEGRRALLKELLAVVGGGERTVLLSTHITSDLERVADRVAVLKDGRIVFAGELGELKDSVKRLRVAATAPLPASVDIPGVISYAGTGGTGLATVRGDVAAAARRFSNDFGASVEVEDLNLEDIFLELHR